jgi:hypothetical protein
MTCPVCGGPMPPRKPRGRPAQWCSAVCRERARQRRTKAARLLEQAATREACIGKSGYGSAEYLQGRADRLRGMAVEILESIDEVPS